MIFSKVQISNRYLFGGDNRSPPLCQLLAGSLTCILIIYLFILFFYFKKWQIYEWVINLFINEGHTIIMLCVALSQAWKENWSHRSRATCAAWWAISKQWVPSKFRSFFSLLSNNGAFFLIFPVILSKNSDSPIFVNLNQRSNFAISHLLMKKLSKIPFSP